MTNKFRKTRNKEGSKNPKPQANGTSSSVKERLRKELELTQKVNQLRGLKVKFSDALDQLGREHEPSIRRLYVSKEEHAIFPDLVENKSGVLVPKANSPENLAVLIKGVLKLDLGLNLLKERICIGTKPITDADMALIRNEARRLGLNDSVQFSNDVVDEIARKQSFHPAKNHIESVKWDGTDHIAELFNTITVNPEFIQHTELYKTFLKRWLIGVIAKIYSPGSQNVVITFQGPQSAGKSRWFAKLDFGCGTHAEGTVDPSNKDDKIKHLDYVTFHLSELDNLTNKKEAAAIKDYLTKEFINERPAYGRYERTGKSVCSFCASVNEDKFLSDHTGSRRFLVIPVTSLDHTHSVNMQQVFAQAKYLFDQGERWWYERGEVTAINDYNDEFTHVDTMDLIASRIEPGEHEASAIEILTSAGVENPGKNQLSKLGVLLKKKGIQAKRKTVGGLKFTVYSISSIATPWRC